MNEKRTARGILEFWQCVFLREQESLLNKQREHRPHFCVSVWMGNRQPVRRQ